MAEVCGVGIKNLPANFRVEDLFWSRNVFRYFLVQINSSYINTEPDNLCNYFEHLLVYLYDLDDFLYVPGIRMNTLLNLL